ncbi:unnamed protein product [Leptosia nina]|uniref:Uncharacterized protein n=1 Tax=Leptosia nina TaxID=320188 RepID=A0AAV1K530_9NEOP
MAHLSAKPDLKQQLLEKEQRLLNEIKYYQQRIEETKSSKRTAAFDSDSSESETEFNIEDEPLLADLVQQEKRLRTCVLATEELTNVVIVQSEMNVLVEAPVIEGEAQISEAGVWKEMVAECRIGYVPISISFFTHQSKRQFAPISYRGLQVLPVKKSQERELSHSVLPQLRIPVHAVHLIQSYNTAYHCRRTVLAKLTDKYGDSLYMEARPEGGCLLKCANVLELSWVLENKVSYLSKFHHKMSLSLEYIDESYLRVIQKANRKLENQSIHTDERTLLLSTIIETCLQARGITSEKNTDDSQRPRIDENDDANIMAPPKLIPKKTKTNKENAQKSSTDVKKNNGVKNSKPNDKEMTAARKSDKSGKSNEDTIKKSNVLNEKNRVETDRNTKSSDNKRKLTDETQNTAVKKSKNNVLNGVIETTSKSKETNVKSTINTKTNGVQTQNVRPDNRNEHQKNLNKNQTNNTDNTSKKSKTDQHNNIASNEKQNLESGTSSTNVQKNKANVASTENNQKAKILGNKNNVRTKKTTADKGRTNQNTLPKINNVASKKRENPVLENKSKLDINKKAGNIKVQNGKPKAIVQNKNSQKSSPRIASKLKALQNFKKVSHIPVLKRVK